MFIPIHTERTLNADCHQLKFHTDLKFHTGLEPVQTPIINEFNGEMDRERS